MKRQDDKEAIEERFSVPCRGGCVVLAKEIAARYLLIQASLAPAQPPVGWEYLETGRSRDDRASAICHTARAAPKVTIMLTLRIGVSLTMLREPLRAAMRTAASLGVRGVLLDARQGVRPEELSETGLRQFRKLLEDYNLRVAAVAFPTRRGYGVSEDLDRRVEATKQVMLFARQLGTDVVINQIGQVPTDESSTTWQTLVQVLTDLGNFSNRAGAFLTAKTGSEPAADLARLLAALPEGSIGVDLDPGQLVMNGFSSLEAAELLGQYVRHVTVNDAVRDLGIGRGTEVQIGRGVVDWPALLGALEEHDYRGWLTIERRNAEEPARECAEAVEYLENL